MIFRTGFSAQEKGDTNVILNRLSKTLCNVELNGKYQGKLVSFPLKKHFLTRNTEKTKRMTNAFLTNVLSM